MKPEVRSHRQLLWLWLIGGAVIAQGLAFGARIADLNNPVVASLQAVAVLLVLAAVGFAALKLHNRKYLPTYAALVTASDRPVWLANRVPATAKSLTVLSAHSRGDVSLLFVISFESEGLQVIDLPSGKARVMVEFTSISDVQVGRTSYFGGASDCLVIRVDVAAGPVEVPIVLFRETAPGYLVQNADQLREAARILTECIERNHAELGSRNSATE